MGWLRDTVFRRERSAPHPEVIGPADPVLTSTIVAIVAFGVVMVFSASAVFASQRYDDPFHFLARPVSASACTNGA